jgi:hypothetical protein
MSLIFRWHQSCGPPQTPASGSSSSARKKDARPRGRAARFRPFWLIRLPPFFFFSKMMARVLTFSLFSLFSKDFHKYTLLERFQKIDPKLGAVDHDAELTCLGATDHGAGVLGLKTISVTLL